jgi:O-antigen/teichoic acid export membrane protein
LISALLGLACVAFAYFYGRVALLLLYKPDYSSYYIEFIWLMIGAGLGFIGSILGYALTSARLFRLQIPLFGSTLIVTLLMCILLVPSRGIFGGALAILLSVLYQITASTILLKVNFRSFNHNQSI